MGPPDAGCVPAVFAVRWRNAQGGLRGIGVAGFVGQGRSSPCKRATSEAWQDAKYESSARAAPVVIEPATIISAPQSHAACERCSPHGESPSTKIDTISRHAHDNRYIGSRRSLARCQFSPLAAASRSARDRPRPWTSTARRAHSVVTTPGRTRPMCGGGVFAVRRFSRNSRRPSRCPGAPG
jgi:hypothetical protein